MSVHQRPGGTSSVRQHLVDDHGANPGWCETASDGAVRPAVGRGYHLCPQFCLCCGLAGTHLTDNCTCQRNCYCRGSTR